MNELKTEGRVILHPESFAVINVGSVPKAKFFAIVRDVNGITVVLPESELGKVGDLAKCERGFRLFTFDMILPFDLVGFISKILTALADARISVLVFSSYSTDHILVKGENVDKAIDILRDLGFEIEKVIS